MKFNSFFILFLFRAVLDYQMFADRTECGKRFERRGWQNVIRTIRRLFTAGENDD